MRSFRNRGAGSTLAKHGSAQSSASLSKKKFVEPNSDDEFSADEDTCQAKPCLNPRSGTVEWIACDICACWFHQICVGIHFKSQVG